MESSGLNFTILKLSVAPKLAADLTFYGGSVGVS